MNSKELSNYLEKIRYGRKMTQESFVDGIVSLRQYQRYRYGESEIPYEKIELFASKLGIPTKKLLNEFEKEKNKQATLLSTYYNAVINKDLARVQVIRSELKQTIIIEAEKQVFLKHANIIHDRYTRKITAFEAFRANAELVNYPEVLKQAYFTDIEVLILSTLLDDLENKAHRTLLKRLTDLFDTQESIMAGESDLIYTLILWRLAKTYGLQRQFAQVIELCQLGIERGRKNLQYYLWEYFYYYMAIAYYRLQDVRHFENALFKCYVCLHAEGNQKKIEKFTYWIERDFDIVYHTFIMKYMKKSIM